MIRNDSLLPRYDVTLIHRQPTSRALTAVGKIMLSPQVS